MPLGFIGDALSIVPKVPTSTLFERTALAAQANASSRSANLRLWAGGCGLLSRAGRRTGRIDEDGEFGGFGSLLGLPQADGFEALVVQLEILGKVVANNF